MKQYKLLSLLLIATSGMYGAKAQNPQPETNNLATPETPSYYYSQWNVGPVVGATINFLDADMGYMTNRSSLPFIGTAAGISATYNLKTWFAVRADLLYLQKNNIYAHSSLLEKDEVAFNTINTNSYLNLPVMADFSFGRKVRFHLRAGGYIGYWLSGRQKGSAIPLVSEVSTFDSPYTFDKIRDNRFDAGYAFGMGLSIHKWKRVMLDIDYHLYYAVTDMQKNYMMEQPHRYNSTSLLQVRLAFNL